MTRHSPITSFVLLMAAALLLSGCGDDRAPTGGSSSGSGSGGYSASAPATSLPDPPASAPDPLVSGAGGAGAGGASTDDPLLQHAPVSQDDPLTHSDPLSGKDPLAQDDPLQGRTMPTEHSHWLRGRVRDARLTVLLNGVRQGEYSGVVDQDITMKLRPGINSVSFLYSPIRENASAQMDLVESEHNPPIPPLVKFQSARQTGSATSVQMASQSFMFFAK